MNYNYNYEYHTDSMPEEVLLVVLGIWLVVALFAAAVSLALYVVRALSLYTIAKRRGIRNPWLSWVPVGGDWIIGSLSDQYQYLVKGKIRSLRKVLLALSLASLICGTVGGVWSFVRMVVMFSGRAGQSLTPVIGGMAVSVVSMLVGIAATVVGHICKYDVYRSCDPKNAVAFLVIAIFIGVTEPFFLLACRKKDLGMPPRRDAVPEEPAAPMAEVLPEPEPAVEPEAEFPAPAPSPWDE